MKRSATGFLTAFFALATMQNSSAADLFGLYVGGSVAEAQLKASETVPVDHQLEISGSVFDERATAFKLLAGIRPLPFLGAEVAYDDFGRATGSYGGAPTNQYFYGFSGATLSMKGESAFAMLYLPLPHLDLFAKAGVATIRNHLTAIAGVICPPPGPPVPCPTNPRSVIPVDADRTDSNFAAGAGAQFNLGSWAIRSEYEYFTAAGAHPTLLSLGASWSFR